MTTQAEREHIATELDFQVNRIWQQIGNLPPTGGEGWGTLKYEELADVAKRATDALREVRIVLSLAGEAAGLGVYTGSTGE